MTKLNIIYTKVLIKLTKNFKSKYLQKNLSKRAKYHVQEAMKIAENILANGTEEEKSAILNILSK